uniref:Fibrinogen C-terminal domain-containing protein n=1 Tax=Percolomonas cosmopolitus TaxID=63605 RepID=A0A7S1PJ77_9EUKA|eukprot:CAMPEP_0117441556 /NCGR_PEP_ID=MMETSP0759-20121206/3695_1 /TAXON_ID=63605 /ORGANISM="Percolomonas cosmopolitus, Strain WS" /LENGTH=320 /DNA_ID=CAMNT_0005233413 /DNA_START=147 /DNA_END=1109 /DNA_ORIENTATION=+
MSQKLFYITLLLSIVLSLLSLTATSQTTPPAQTPKDEKDELKDMIESLSTEFKNEKTWAEQELYNVHVEALQRKIAAISAEADASYADSLLSASLRLLQTVKLIDSVKERKTDPVVLTGKVAEKPARDCSELRKGTPTTGELTSINDGIFWVTDKIRGVSDLYRTRCDMTIAGGGWQLFGLKTKMFGAVEDTDLFKRDFNRDRLTDVRHYANQFNTLNLERFDSLYGKEFDILVKVGDSLFEASHYILITNKQRTSGHPSDVADDLVKHWIIPKGEKCVALEGVGRACLIEANGDEIVNSLNDDVDAFSTKVVSSFWIRK